MNMFIGFVFVRKDAITLVFMVRGNYILLILKYVFSFVYLFIITSPYSPSVTIVNYTKYAWVEYTNFVCALDTSVLNLSFY